LPFVFSRASRGIERDRDSCGLPLWRVGSGRAIFISEALFTGYTPIFLLRGRKRIADTLRATMFVAMAAELVILIGLQASGKSTFFRERFAATHAHVSKDLFRNNRNRNRRQQELVEAALLAGCPVVVDNTNPTVEERRSLTELGRRFGARIVGCSFESGVRECLARNALREGKARVPDVAIYATAKRLVLPSHAEGFDELLCVRLNGYAFEVRVC
jgi:predicted kinase